MDLTASWATDYLTWDNVEPAGVVIERARLSVPAPVNDQQLRKGQPGAPFDPAAAPSANAEDFASVAKRRNLTRKEQAASFGTYTAKDRVWLVPAAVMGPGFEIKPGDVIVGKRPLNEFDTDRWTVLEADLGKYGQTWRLTTRNLSLAYELQELINIERPAVSYDAAMAPVKAWPTGPQPLGGIVLYGNLPARPQLLTKEIKDERGIRGLERRYDVIVGRQVAVTNEDRIAWRGEYLDIIGYRNAERIDELPIIEALGKV